MKKIYFLLLALATLTATSACRVEKADDGEPSITRHIEAKDFESIAIAFPADVTFIPSDTFGVDVKAPAKQMEKVDIKVEDGQLRIYKKEDGEDRHYIVLNSRGEMQVTVRAPRLTSVSLAGSGSFVCNDTLRSDHLNLSIAGSGDVEAALAHVDNTNISIAGSGDVDVDFKACKSVNASILGSGDIDLSGDVESLTKNIGGSGDIDTHKLRTRE